MIEASLGRWISLLYRYGQIFIGEELEPYHIGHGQFQFLMVLYREDGLCQEELARILNIDKGTTARAVCKLEKAGYVCREQSRADMRANRVFLTPQALEFKPKLEAVLRRWTGILSAGLTGEEVEQAFSLLERMAQNAVRHIRKEKNG